MYKILNKGTRSIIVHPKDVLKGGKVETRMSGKEMISEVAIAPGDTIYHVTDSLGQKLLSSYKSEIMLVEIVKEKNKSKNKKDLQPA